MATKQELLNAMKVVKEHCESFEFDQCSKCDGKGYTETEGVKEDLELAQAVRWAEAQDMYMTDDEMWSCNLEQLVLMYRDLKGE